MNMDYSYQYAQNNIVCHNGTVFVRTPTGDYLRLYGDILPAEVDEIISASDVGAACWDRIRRDCTVSFATVHALRAPSHNQ
jgi:hypothetical protein